MSNIERQIDLTEIKKMLKARLSPQRYKPSLAVSRSAVSLAKRYDCDIQKAELAGLVHDICKDDSKEVQLQTAKEFGIILTEFELSCPKLWHSIVGAEYVRQRIIDDDDIVNAVRYHTSARMDMSLLEKVIYVADCISSDRTFKGVSQLRTLAKKSLDGVILSMTRTTLEELVRASMPLHSDTVNAYNQLCVK